MINKVEITIKSDMCMVSHSQRVPPPSRRHSAPLPRSRSQSDVGYKKDPGPVRPAPQSARVSIGSRTGIQVGANGRALLKGEFWTVGRDPNTEVCFAQTMYRMHVIGAVLFKAFCVGYGFPIHSGVTDGGVRLYIVPGNCRATLLLILGDSNVERVPQER